MVEEADMRFKLVCKMKGRRNLRKVWSEFVASSDEVQELFLQVNRNRLFSASPCSMDDFGKLVALGYRTQRDVGDAIISDSGIIEHNLYLEVVPHVRNILRPDGSMLDSRIDFALKHAQRSQIMACMHDADFMQAMTELANKLKIPQSNSHQYSF